MNTENAIQQMRKGVLELCTLSIIANYEEVYPANIREGLKIAGIEVVEGTLYPLYEKALGSAHSREP